MSSRVSVPVRLLAVLAAAIAVSAICVSSASAGFAGIGSFSGLGADPGLLTTPKRAAVDQDTGNLFVVDQGNDRVQVFTPDGNSMTYLTSFGSGTLDEPFGIAIDQAADAVYVSDAGTANAVRKWAFNDDPTPAFAADGGFTSPTLGADPDQLESFAAPLAVAPNGDLWVADPVANEAKRFTSTGAHVAGSNFDGSSFSGGPFTGLLDVAVDSTGDVLVVDATGSFDDLVNQAATSRVERFAPDGSHEATVGSTNRPSTVAVDPDGDRVVVAADTDSYSSSTNTRPSIHVFEADGTSVVGGSVNALWAYTSGLAVVGGGSTRIYAITGEPRNDGFGPTGGHVFADVAPPTATLEPPSGLTGNTATLHGTVNPHGTDTTSGYQVTASYHFEHRKQGATIWKSTPTQDAGTGNTAIDVEADLDSLHALSAYEYRLVAENPAGTDTTTVEPFSTTAAPPGVETLDAIQITANDAWLKANINPNKQATTYYFEYGTTTGYGTAIPATKDASAGQGVTAVEVTKAIHDLQPNTIYHYRVVAQNDTGRSEGTDRTFTTAATTDTCPNAAVRFQQRATSLPDCRAYELVSPADKVGYGVGGNGDGVPGVSLGVSVDGGKVTYDSTFPLPGSEAGGWSGFLSERGLGGWSTLGLPKFHGPNAIGNGAPSAVDVMLLSATPDQRTAVYYDCTTAPWGALWIRRSDGSRQQIAAAQPPLGDRPFCAEPGRDSGFPWFLGISPDGRHVVFNNTIRLGPAADLPPGPGRILYEWVDDGTNGGAGTLRVVNRTDDPTLALLSGEDASLGGGTVLAGHGYLGRDGMRNLNRVISDGSDGHSRIFFQNPAPLGVKEGGGPLYVRADGTKTVELSGPVAGHTPECPVTPTGVKYLAAAKDGSRVFFYADGDLTPDAPAGDCNPPPDNPVIPGGGLYRYDVDPDGPGPGEASLTWIDEVPAGTATTGMADADASHFYYQAELPVDGQGTNPDLRLYTGGTVKSIGAFTVRADKAEATSGNFFVSSNDSMGLQSDSCPSVGVTPDGRYLAFAATTSAEINTLQVYRYDSLGAGGAGEVQRLAKTPLAPNLPIAGAGFMGDCYPDRASGRKVERRVISDDGQVVFFDTKVPLVEGDSNGFLDAYRWREGSGVALVSPGTGPRSSFQGTDATGENAFIATRDQLALQDGDPSNDLYDVKVGGGFEVALRGDCSGDACQGDQSGRPGLPPAASGRSRGAGDAVSGRGGGFSLVKPTAKQRMALARGRAISLKVKVSRAGRVSVTATAKLAGRAKTVARSSKRASKAGTVVLSLRLSKAARGQLARKRRLGVALAVRFAGVDEPRRLSLALRRGK